MKPFATYEQKKRESRILDGIDQSDLFPDCVLYMDWEKMRPVPIHQLELGTLATSC